MNTVVWLSERMNRQYPHYYLSPVWRELEYLHVKELQTLHQTIAYILANSACWHKSHHWTKDEQTLRNQCGLINIAVERIIKTKGGVLC